MWPSTGCYVTNTGPHLVSRVASNPSLNRSANGRPPGPPSGRAAVFRRDLQFAQGSAIFGLLALLAFGAGSHFRRGRKRSAA